MGGTCSSDCGEGDVYRVWWVNLKERDHWRDPRVDGRIILRWIFSKCDVGVWIVLAQDRDMWRALVNAVMDLQVP
jgi:hypothetical protein